MHCYSGPVGGISFRQQRQHQFRRSVAIVDAANPWNNFFLAPTQTKEVTASLMDGKFLLLTAHRQAGKTSLAQAIVTELQESGCRTAVIWLTMLHSEHGHGIFKRILDLLEVPHCDDDNPQR